MKIEKPEFSEGNLMKTNVMKKWSKRIFGCLCTMLIDYFQMWN